MPALLLYRAGLCLYRAAIGIAALLGNAKARLWIQGRQRWRQRLPSLQQPALWLHASSLGEFEQGRPVLEALMAAHPGMPVLVTFFSPSGYEARKDYPAHVHYLPLDSPAAARTLLDAVPVRMAIFVKYDFWYHYLHELKRRHIPTYLISACISPRSSMFRWPMRGLYRRMLGCYTHIYTQDSQTVQLLQQHFGLQCLSQAGDTRFDRALELPAAPDDFDTIRNFIAGRFCIVGGSTYPHSEGLLAQAMQHLQLREAVLLLAPHQVDEAHIQQILQRLGSEAVRLSQLQPGSTGRVLVIDSIGKLARLYRLGQVAYVGGGFRDGIHNVLESAVHGCYTLFGPHHQKFPEAQAMLNAGVASEVHHAQDLTKQLVWAALHPSELAEKQLKARTFVQQNAGATERIVVDLITNL